MQDTRFELATSNSFRVFYFKDRATLSAGCRVALPETMGKLKKIIEKAKKPFGTNNYTLWAKGVKEGYDRGYEKAKE